MPTKDILCLTVKKIECFSRKDQLNEDFGLFLLPHNLPHSLSQNISSSFIKMCFNFR